MGVGVLVARPASQRPVGSARMYRMIVNTYVCVFVLRNTPLLSQKAHMQGYTNERTQEPKSRPHVHVHSRHGRHTHAAHVFTVAAQWCAQPPPPPRAPAHPQSGAPAPLRAPRFARRNHARLLLFPEGGAWRRSRRHCASSPRPLRESLARRRDRRAKMGRRPRRRRQPQPPP